MTYFLQGAGGGFASQLPLFAAIMMIFYFVLIRPQAKERKAQESLRSNLKKGDRVVSQAGIIGKIHQVKDDEVVLELENGRVRILKATILRVLEAKTATVES